MQSGRNRVDAIGEAPSVSVSLALFPPQLRNPEKLRAPAHSQRIRLTILIPFPILSPLLFQLRSPFPLADPSPVLASVICRRCTPGGPPPASSPASRGTAVSRSLGPAPSPAARSQGRDCLRFRSSVPLISPSLTAPPRLYDLGLGTSWVESRTQTCVPLSPPVPPPALQSRVNVSQRAKVRRAAPAPRSRHPQLSRSSFQNPRSVFQTRVGRALLGHRRPIYPLRPGPPCPAPTWPPVLPPLQPPADAAASSCCTLPRARSFHQGGRGSRGGPGLGTNQRLSGRKGWWREEAARNRGLLQQRAAIIWPAGLAWEAQGSGPWRSGWGRSGNASRLQSPAKTAPLLALTLSL